MRAVVSLVVAVLAAAALWSAGASPEAGAQESDAFVPPETPEGSTAGFTVGDSGSSHVWSTTATGTRVVRLTVHYGSTQSCILKATATGQTSSAPWLLYFGHDSVGRVWNAVELTDLIGGGIATHAHVGNFAVAEALPNGNWFSEITLGVTASGSQTFLVAGWALKPIAPPFGNNLALRISVSCGSSVTIAALETGTTAHAWKPYNMRGGVGHTTGFGLDTTSNVVDTTGAVAMPNTISHLRLRSEDQAATGLLQVDTPGADFNALLTGDDDVFHSGANGVYRATLSRLGVGEGQKTILLLVGTDTVLSL